MHVNESLALMSHFSITLTGQALICTSTDEPSVIVPLLKKKDGTASIMKGHYRLAGDIVNIVATRIQKNPCEPRSRRTNKQSSIKEHVFHLVSHRVRVIVFELT